MTGSARALLVLALASGCSAWTARPDRDEAARPSTASLLADAEREADAGRVRDANTRYEAIVRERPGDPLAPEALYRLALLRVEPGSPLRDRRIAQSLFRRLAADYPGTPQGRQARSWRFVLRELDRCEVEATRRGADAERLRQTLDSIRDSDLELEQHP